MASVNNIWRLMCTPVPMQIKQLLACKEFELALHLAVSHSSPSFFITGLNVSFFQLFIVCYITTQISTDDLVEAVSEF